MAANAARADAQAQDIAPMIEEGRAGGAVSLRAIATHLDEAGANTAKGSTWTAAAVQRVRRRPPARNK
jgi:hypothetical protein